MRGGEGREGSEGRGGEGRGGEGRGGDCPHFPQTRKLVFFLTLLLSPSVMNSTQHPVNISLILICEDKKHANLLNLIRHAFYQI